MRKAKEALLRAALLLAALGAGLAAAAPATDRAPGGLSPSLTDAPPQKALRHRGGRTAAAGDGLEDRVKLLTAELHLDELQQAGVRQALVEQRQQTLRVWSDPSVPAVVRVKATQGVADRTAARIRALLTEDQRRHYLQQMPDDPSLRGNSADLAHWMDKMREP